VYSQPHDVHTTLSDAHPLAIFVEKFCGLKEPDVDADGLYNGLIMPPEQHWILWGCSVFAIGTATYALIREMYDSAFISYCIAFTSLNYWRRPMYCWRRNVDILCVSGGLVYHIIYKANYSEFRAIYFTIVAVGICAYGLSVYTHKKSSWISTFFHVIVHICANLSHCILFSSRNLTQETF
jgi:hypothetical protein